MHKICTQPVPIVHNRMESEERMSEGDEAFNGQKRVNQKSVGARRTRMEDTRAHSSFLNANRREHVVQGVEGNSIQIRHECR